MAYFRQTDSLDDLRDQYKNLLKKFDFKDPKNAKILEEIEKEYKKQLVYTKMAPLRKAKNDFVRKLDEEERARVQAEHERAEYNAEIKRRTQMHYTREDCQNYLNAACRELKKYAYLKVQRNVESGSASTCRSDLYSFKMDGNRKTYINLRTLGKITKNNELARVIETGDNVEIAFVSLCNENNKDQMLRKLEEKLGAIYVNSYKEACEKYMDDVDYARTLAQQNKQDREEKIVKPFRTVSYAMARIVASIVFGTIAFGFIMVIFALFEEITKSKVIRNAIFVVGIVVGIFVARLVIKLVNRLLDFDQYREVTTRKTAYSRVTEGEKYDEIKKNENISKNTSGIVRLICRLLGIRI